MKHIDVNEDDFLIDAFENGNMPPVLKGVMDEIDNMSKKELKAFAKSVLLNLADLQEKHIDLQRQYNSQSTDYLSRCRSVGGITLPPNM